MKGNELINILNLEAVEHAFSECTQFEFWREMSRATSNNQDMTVQLGRAAYMQEKEKEQINVLNL